MKLAFVVASVSRKAGGLYESVRRLAQSLSSSAESVEVFGLEDEETEADRFRWDPLPVRVFPKIGPAGFGFAPALARALLKSDCDLVMSHGLWMYPSIATARWHRKTRRPYVVHPHGMLASWAVSNSAIKKRIAAMLYERGHLHQAACIRALCESEAQAIRDYGLQNPICIIPNGIDLPIAAEGPAKGLPEQSSVVRRLSLSGRRVLLYLGRLHPKKGLVSLLRAWAVVQKVKWSSLTSRPGEWVLVIAGWDQNGHEAKLKKLAGELGLRWSDSRGREDCEDISRNSQVVFIGPQFGRDKNACYSNCDAFVLPSFSEGLPMAVLEAWAYGKPVLMTAECNLPEGFAANAALPIRFRKSTGPERSEPLEVANTLRQLFELSRDDSCSMGDRGRRLVIESFSWGKVAEQMCAVYEWILRSAPRPACVHVT